MHAVSQRASRVPQVRSSDEIAAAHAGNFSTEQDLLVVMTSTVGIPTVVLS